MELHDQRDQSPTLVCNSNRTGTRAQQQHTCAGASSCIQWLLSGWRNKRRKEGGEVQRRLILLRMLICTLAVPFALVAASSSSSSPNSPTFLPGSLIAWLICSSRKRSPIGGWLFFFYWQIYSSLLLSAVFFAINIQSYVPENFDSSSKCALFLANAVPSLLLLVVKCAIATLLLSARTWDMLKLLRWVMVAELSADIVATVIDAAYFPDNMPFNFLTIISGLIWVAYMFRSTRVRHIFYSHDWDMAVNSIHPLKPKMAT